MYIVKSSEVNVALVNHMEATSFIRDEVQVIDIVRLGVRNNHKCRNGGLYIK